MKTSELRSTQFAELQARRDKKTFLPYVKAIKAAFIIAVTLGFVYFLHHIYVLSSGAWHAIPNTQTKVNISMAGATLSTLMGTVALAGKGVIWN